MEIWLTGCVTGGAEWTGIADSALGQSPVLFYIGGSRRPLPHDTSYPFRSLTGQPLKSGQGSKIFVRKIAHDKAKLSQFRLPLGLCKVCK